MLQQSGTDLSAALLCLLHTCLAVDPRRRLETHPPSFSGRVARTLLAAPTSAAWPPVVTGMWWWAAGTAKSGCTATRHSHRWGGGGGQQALGRKKGVDSQRGQHRRGCCCGLQGHRKLKRSQLAAARCPSGQSCWCPHATLTCVALGGAFGRNPSCSLLVCTYDVQDARTVSCSPACTDSG
jgi:hypothetical protein